MNIIDIIHEFLISKADHLRRYKVIRRSTELKVLSLEHGYYLDFSARPPYVSATVQYLDNPKYKYNMLEDRDESVDLEYHIVGYRHLGDFHSPNFIERVDNTLDEFLREDSEWVTRRMRREVRRISETL